MSATHNTGRPQQATTAGPALPGRSQPATTAEPALPGRSQPATTAEPALPGSSQPGQAQLASPRPAQPGSADGAAGQRDQAAVRRFIERFTAQLTQAGFPRTPARIFVALLTADSSSLTAAQLADLLQASPASVSGGARYLIQVGLVTAEGEPGSRRQHYRMPDTVWRDMVSLRDQLFGRWVAELRDGIEVLGADSPAGLRMADTVRYFEFLQVEMAGLLTRWIEHGASRD